jgi:hypothetical protein
MVTRSLGRCHVYIQKSIALTPLQLQTRRAWCRGLGYLRSRVYKNIFCLMTPYRVVEFYRRFGLLIAFFFLAYSLTLKREAIRSPETLVDPKGSCSSETTDSCTPLRCVCRLQCSSHSCGLGNVIMIHLLTDPQYAGNTETQGCSSLLTGFQCLLETRRS